MPSKTYIPLSTCSCSTGRQTAEIDLCRNHDTLLIRSIERGDLKKDFEPAIPAEPNHPAHPAYQLTSVGARTITFPGGTYVRLTDPIPPGLVIEHAGFRIEFS